MKRYKKRTLYYLWLVERKNILHGTGTMMKSKEKRGSVWMLNKTIAGKINLQEWQLNIECMKLYENKRSIFLGHRKVLCGKEKRKCMNSKYKTIARKINLKDGELNINDDMFSIMYRKVMRMFCVQVLG